MQKMSINKLYRFYSKGGQLLYVGISQKIFYRLHSHQKTKAWINDVARIDIEDFESYESLCKAESEAIEKEVPLHNIINSNINDRPPRPAMMDAKKRQRVAFADALSMFINSQKKSWSSCAYELGICHTAISRWKNARVCPSEDMRIRIEAWSGGAIRSKDFDFSNFK